MNLLRNCRSLLLLLTFTATCWGELPAGEPIVINPNGGWSWFGDERAVVDSERGVLYVGSLANAHGEGGKDKDGDVDVTRVDLATGETTIDVLHHGLTSYGGGDDHNVASLLVLPDGRCLAAYTGHNNAPITYFRTYDPDQEEWDEERTFDWNAEIEGGCDFACTYNNLFYIAEYDLVVNISRNHRRCPNVIASDDLGATWWYVGQLLKPAAAEGATGFYVNGYLKYSQSGDRVHLVSTERHPRNYSTSLFYGYVDSSRLYDGAGTVLDVEVDAEAQVDATSLTPIYKATNQVDGVEMNHAWMADVEAYPDGRVAVLFKTRAGGSVEDHRFFYAIGSGAEWSVHQLAKAGPRLFHSEEDYTGLAALDPNSPDVIYISTPIDPTSGESTAHHELYQGKTSDSGSSWTWRAVTQDSETNNFRPIIPRWAPGRTALIWNRGTMTRSQVYDQQVMLMVDPLSGETAE